VNPFEIQDARDQLVGVLHLADGLLAHLVPEPVVAPVLAHAGVDEVLVDRGQLVGEDLVQGVDDLIVSTHGIPPTSVW
jgi:hypothetical protein